MRRHDARKWLHAILDLLPVILIPVFMIYSHRHTIDSYSITTYSDLNINLYQNVINGEPNSFDNWWEDGDANSGFTGSSIRSVMPNETEMNLYAGINLNINANDKILIDFVCTAIGSSVSVSSYNGYDDYFITDESFTISNVLNQRYQNIFTTPYDYESDLEDEDKTFSWINFYSYNDTGSQKIFYIHDLMVFNLTQIFGIGNEPTVNEFNDLFKSPYYSYGDNYLTLEDYIVTTYNDTDIMSQFTYNLYNSVDKYFNMNNVFGMNNVYNWFVTNIFNGNAPIYIFIVWNIVLYEFVMDLLMLLYALFMWFIDFCQDLIDRCFTTSKGGKH